METFEVDVVSEAWKVRFGEAHIRSACWIRRDDAG